MGSPSALADPDLNQKLRQAAQQYGRTLYVPSGALWGGQDIQRLNDSGVLKVTWGSVECLNCGNENADALSFAFA